MKSKILNSNFERYRITEDGLMPALAFPDKRQLGSVRDGFLHELDRLHSSELENVTNRSLARIFATSWTRSVMKAIYTSHQIEFFQAHNYQIECGERFPFLSTALRGSLPSNDWYIEELINGPKKYPIWRWPLRLFRRLSVRPTIFSAPGGAINFNKYAACLTTGFLIERHAQLADRKIAHIDAAYWFGPHDASSQGDEAFKVSLMQASDHAANVSGIKLTGVARDWLEKQFKFTVSDASYHLEGLREHQHIPSVLWSGSSSFVWERMLAAEVMRRGGRVTAHDHGSGTAGVNNHMPYMLKGLCTDFFTFNLECDRGLTESFRKYGFHDAPAPTMASLSQFDDGLHEVQEVDLNENARIATPEKNSILIIPSNLVGEHMHFIPYSEDVPKLDFIVRLTAFLAGLGYDVTLKPHPSYPFPEKVDFSSIRGNVEIDTRRFEDIVDEYGMVIYGHPRTTTLKWAIDHKRPCIVLNPVPDGWTEEEKDLYSKFMMFLDVHTDDAGRLNMNWDSFESILAQLSPERQYN